eukprot:5700449-Alexandrium_andersonii.AAC.1
MPLRPRKLPRVARSAARPESRPGGRAGQRRKRNDRSPNSSHRQRRNRTGGIALPWYACN